METYSRLPCPHHGLSIGPSGATGARPHKGPPRKQGLSPMSALTRRAVLAGAAACRCSPSAPARADAAEFSFKMANNSPVTHPQSVRQQEAIDRIKAGHQRRGGNPAVPEQPARLRHRHAVAASLRRDRLLHPVRPDPVDPGAGRLDQRHRLRLQGLRHGLEGDGRQARRLRARRDRQARPDRHGQDVGQRLPPDHQFHQADQDAGRPEGVQDPRAGLAAVDRDVPGVRRLADQRSISARSIPRCRPRSPRGRKTRCR